MLIKFWANKQKQEFLHRDIRVRSMKCEKINSRNFFGPWILKQQKRNVYQPTRELYISYLPKRQRGPLSEKILAWDRTECSGTINSQCDPESHDLDHDHGLERTPVRIPYWGSSTRLFTSNVLKDKRENKVGLEEEQKKKHILQCKNFFWSS